jgi:transcription antitermination factor NusG
VEHFIELTDGDGILNLESQLTLGQNVHVVHGPFTFLPGSLVNLDGNGRAQVLLAIMNGNIPVTMATRDIVPWAAEVADKIR